MASKRAIVIYRIVVNIVIKGLDFGVRLLVKSKTTKQKLLKKYVARLKPKGEKRWQKENIKLWMIWVSV